MHKFVLLSLFGIGMSSLAPAVLTYSVTDLGNIGGTFLRPQSINNRREIVGAAATSNGNIHGFYWSPSTSMIDLGSTGGVASWAYGINDLGQVVGSTAMLGAGDRAFQWSLSGGLTNLGNLGGGRVRPYAINNSGVITGEGTNTSSNGIAFRKQPGGNFEDLGQFPFYPMEARDINASGQIAGFGSNGSENRGFLWDPSSGFRSLGTFGGQTFAYGINDLGAVVGTSTQGNVVRPFVWTETTGLVALPSLGTAGSKVFDINNSGVAAGSSATANFQERAVLWDPALAVLDLNDYLDASGAGWVLQTAYDVNDNGDVIGIGFFNGSERAFLLTPSTVPEPGTMIALGIGALALVRRRKSARK